MAAEVEGNPPIIVKVNTTEAEYSAYARAASQRQRRAAGETTGWFAYLGAIPVGLGGGFAGIGFGVPGEYGARVALLICVAYMLGQVALRFASGIYGNQVGRIYLREYQSIIVRIDETGVSSQWRKSTTFWSWEDITQLTREYDHLIFWIGTMRGIPVPRSALAKDQETQILGMARARIVPKPAPKS
jgi:hypothetical protein